MTTLIIGGNNSGKSAFAENLAKRASCGRQVIYLATMMETDEESRIRIERHRRMRRDKGFLLVEKPYDIAAAEIPPDSDVLLEDVANLVANELFGEKGAGIECAISGIEELLGKCHDLIIVSNDFSSYKETSDDETARYIDAVDDINDRLKKIADTVYIMPQTERS